MAWRTQLGQYGGNVMAKRLITYARENCCNFNLREGFMPHQSVTWSEPPKVTVSDCQVLKKRCDWFEKAVLPVAPDEIKEQYRKAHPEIHQIAGPDKVCRQCGRQVGHGKQLCPDCRRKNRQASRQFHGACQSHSPASSAKSTVSIMPSPFRSKSFQLPVPLSGEVWAPSPKLFTADTA